jgi:L-ribulose-5-phosphate 3-epimerase
MNRREFISTSAVGTVGMMGIASGAKSSMSIPRSSLADSRLIDPKERMLKSLKFGMIGEGESMLEKFTLIKECGFDGVELDSPSDFDLEEVLHAKKQTGIQIPGVVLSTHWHKPFNHPDEAVREQAKKALSQAIYDCKALGGTTVLVVPAVVNERMPYAEAYEVSKREIKELVGQAEELDISIAFENVWNNFLLSPMEAARYVDEFESPNVGWYFDIGNIVNYGYPAQWIDTLGHRIMKVDVKDFSRSKRDDEGLWKGFGVKIGDGDAQWESVNKALDRIGYRYWASAEVGGGGADRLTEIANRMDMVFDQVAP